MTAFRSPSVLLSRLEELYAQKGNLRYGEDVTQLQHALQCGALAEQTGLLGKGSALQRMLQLSHVFTVTKVSLLRIKLLQTGQQDGG